MTMSIDTVSTLMPIFIIVACVWIGWLFWAATSFKASSSSRTFAVWMISTSWPFALILLAIRGTDAHFDGRKEDRREGEGEGEAE